MRTPSEEAWRRKRVLGGMAAGLVGAAVALAACAHPAARPRAPSPAPAAPAGAYPFGIRPRVAAGAQMRDLLDYYAAWKARYVRHGACGADRTYIDSSRDAGEPGSITVSEAHGWGMLIFAMMAPLDPEARELFDGMVRFFEDHPSTLGSGLMAWDVHAPCHTPQASTSAPDGDLDIAYALLVADRRWGSSHGLDYAARARAQMAALLETEAVPEHGYFRLWEYIAPGAPHALETRTSDAMFGHFRAFRVASRDPRWSLLLERTYRLLGRLAEQSPAGFFPDFARGLESAPRSAPEVFRDDGRDGTYSYNACRLPLRWGLDAIESGDRRSQALAGRLVEGIRRACGGDPARVVDGYGLDGRQLGTRSRLAFLAPLAVGAMADAAHQDFLDALYRHIVAAPMEEDGYYGNALKMLALIILSGQWEPAVGRI